MGTQVMVGKEISHYKILEKLGQGGMGVVYKAEDASLDRLVALKFLSPEWTGDEKAKKRFIQEAHAASALDHPNICTIYEINETEDGQMYIAMAYCEGETLQKRMASVETHGRASLQIDEIIDIANQIALGLVKAHEKGIVHRDVTPSNIMITCDGIVKILDFGLAKLSSDIKLTQTGTTMGTVSYMSPEQLRGERIDHRADIWSFGVVLYEMLTGQLPFSGEHTPALIYAINYENFIDVAEKRADTPSYLRVLVEKCLQKDVNKRLDSMRDILDTLRSKKEPKTLSLPFAAHRWRVMAGIVLSTFLLIVVLLIWNLFHSSFPTSDYFSGKWQVSILPFRDYSGRPETEQWPVLIQTMIATELTGAEEFSVVEPLGLNNYIASSLGGLKIERDNRLLQIVRDSDASIIIDGNIRWENNAYVLQSSVLDRKSGEQPITKPFPFTNPDALSQQIKDLTNEIYNYLQVKIVPPNRSKDLKLWISRPAINIDAMKEFFEANQIIFKGMRGTTPHLQRAVELDSLFIAPRIWLISGLVQEGKLQEARHHYQFLQNMEPYANPFEQKMIDWARAYIDHEAIGQMKALKLAVEYSPKNAILLFNLGRTQYELHYYNDAIASLKPIAAIRWQFSPAYLVLALCYHHCGDRKTAKEVALNSLKIQPVYWRIYSLLMRYALEEGDWLNVEKFRSLAIERAIEFGLSKADIYQDLGQEAVKYSVADRAVAFYRNLLTKQPDADMHFELAEIYHAQGAVDSACAELGRVLVLDSSQASAHLRLGEIYESRCDTVRAIKHYRVYLARPINDAKNDSVNKRILRLQ